MNTPSYEDWVPPNFDDHEITLRQALHSMNPMVDGPADIPWIVQFIENPKYQFPILQLFPGACTLRTHDIIHCLLGKGLNPIDEAFVVGFTMGSTKKMNAIKSYVFCLVAKYLYPKDYKFDDKCVEVFTNAWRLAQTTNVWELNTREYEHFMDIPLSVLRKILDIDTQMVDLFSLNTGGA